MEVWVTLRDSSETSILLQEGGPRQKGDEYWVCEGPEHGEFWMWGENTRGQKRGHLLVSSLDARERKPIARLGESLMMGGVGTPKSHWHGLSVWPPNHWGWGLKSGHNPSCPGKPRKLGPVGGVIWHGR